MEQKDHGENNILESKIIHKNFLDNYEVKRESLITGFDVNDLKFQNFNLNEKEETYEFENQKN